LQPSFQDPEWLQREGRCLARVRAGDGEAFAELYQAFAPALYAQVLMPRLGDPEAAQEALAETFRAALERLDQYADRGRSVYFWLATIATHKAMDLHRNRARGGRALADLEALLLPLHPADAAASTAMDERIDGERLRGRIQEVLGRLHPRYRRAIELRFLEDCDRADCAAALEVKLGTFDVLLLRALRAFRAAWVEAASARPEPGEETA
jgi:RNA polymerase sigma-70 factor (ECF subfamily)